MLYIQEMTLTDYMFQGKREEEEMPALKTALMHRYNDSKAICKNTKEDPLQPPEGGFITAIRNDTDNTMDNRMTIHMKQKWEEKQLYGRFKRLISIISHEKTRRRTHYSHQKEDSLQPSETILITRWTTEWQYIWNKNGKKNNSMGVLND